MFGTAPAKNPPKKTEVHIAIDIETFGLATTSVVGAIGLVAFTLQGGEVGSTFILPDMDEQKEFGRTRDRSTCEWWNHPDRHEARKQFDGPVVSIVNARDLIHTFIERFNTSMSQVAGVWGFGSDFDNATVQDLCRTHEGVGAPWNYKLNRCGRTLVALYPDVKKPEPTGEHHNALDDARWLAKYLRLAMMYRNGQQNTLNQLVGRM